MVSLQLYDSRACSKKINFYSVANFMDVVSYRKLIATSISKEETKLENTVSDLKKLYGVGRLDCVFPDGADMSRVEYSKWQGERLVKVMFSCEDKKNLMSEIARAVRSVKGKLVKAEIPTMCRWTECVL
ncbi:hypothetical protein P3X46_012732 [Hevea brasiliensis]|uniref:Uncharacterized protein n=1 Tax=Hevea brasiliensis TaxID=3981 RepID=A0ABQ9MBL1_HEVBR|nr:hypothetical protein P3X46_012732 [Hevea brasiliensis]